VTILGINYLKCDFLQIEQNAKTGHDLDKMEELVSQVKTKVKELMDAFEQDFKLNQ